MTGVKSRVSDLVEHIVLVCFICMYAIVDYLSEITTGP